MEIQTTRFGSVEISADDILLFPSGMPGIEDCRHWVLLSDSQSDMLGWIQCVSRPEIAFAVVSPRRVAQDYHVCVGRGELLPLQMTPDTSVYVLVIVAKNDQGLTVNLKAPLIFNLQRRLGRQVVVSDDQPLQFDLADRQEQLRKSA